MLKSWQLFVHTTNWLRAAGTTTSLSSEYTNAIIKNQIMMSVSSPAIYVSHCWKWAYAQAWWRSQLVSSSRMTHAVRSRSRRTAQCSRIGSSLMMWWHSPTLNLPRDSVSHKEMGPIVLATRKWRTKEQPDWLRRIRAYNRSPPSPCACSPSHTRISYPLKQDLRQEGPHS